ncbi:hypothetical protein HY988_06025 [Candidatus Micrarchaeota archaeon]|nr:hypothetical protein [Candidatus Micrarchaeota archaeon]
MAREELKQKALALVKRIGQVPNLPAFTHKEVLAECVRALAIDQDQTVDKIAQRMADHADLVTLTKTVLITDLNGVTELMPAVGYRAAPAHQAPEITEMIKNEILPEAIYQRVQNFREHYRKAAKVGVVGLSVIAAAPAAWLIGGVMALAISAIFGISNPFLTLCIELGVGAIIAKKLFGKILPLVEKQIERRNGDYTMDILEEMIIGNRLGLSDDATAKIGLAALATQSPFRIVGPKEEQ